MFNAKYTITNKLLDNIKRVNSLIINLNRQHFPKIIQVELQKTAEATSTYASTSIEGNPLPLTEVKQILKNNPKNIRASEQEVINYNQTLKEINHQLKVKPIPLSLSLILLIQKKLTYKLLPSFQSGKLRQEAVFVNDPKLGKTIYWPPEVQDIDKLMRELVGYINNNQKNIDPLILAGIFHKQMVIIHPFMDGNGRTARLVTKILLAQMGLNTFNLFSFENYYNLSVSKYFTMVGAKGNYYDISDNMDFTAWLEYFTDGIIDELLRVEKNLPKTISTPSSQLKIHHKKIIKYIKEKDFITDRIYSTLVSRARATRHLDFRKLIKLSLIKKKAKGKSTYYVLREK